jgi:hypothetical protein
MALPSVAFLSPDAVSGVTGTRENLGSSLALAGVVLSPGLAWRGLAGHGSAREVSGRPGVLDGVPLASEIIVWSFGQGGVGMATPACPAWLASLA